MVKTILESNFEDSFFDKIVIFSKKYFTFESTLFGALAKFRLRFSDAFR